MMTTTSSDTKLERKLESFAEYLCARRGLAECTMADYIGTIRRLVPTIGLDHPHQVVDALIVQMRKSGASYSHVVNTLLALERYTEFIGNPIYLGRPKKPKRMIRGTVAKRAGITKRAWPHLFRHSLATNMLIRGAHNLAITEQLGHSPVETTMVYLHAAPMAMQAQYRFFAPSYL